MRMLWKLLGLQKRFDALFDDGWVRPGFVCGSGFFFEEFSSVEIDGLEFSN
jgi:hypothetical protein